MEPLTDQNIETLLETLRTSPITSPPTSEEETSTSSSSTKPKNIFINPPLIESEDNLTRFRGASWFTRTRDFTVMVAGAGGIGSWATLLLARLGVSNVTVIDFDTITSTNLGGQFYDVRDLGSLKVAALAKQCRIFAEYYNINTSTSRITSNSYISQGFDIYISGFDNMAARKIFFEKLPQRKKALYMDSRMSADICQLITFSLDNEYAKEKYKTEWLFTDEEAVETTCSYKQTSFIANINAGLIANAVTNYAGYLLGDPAKQIPFMKEYNSITMTLKTT